MGVHKLKLHVVGSLKNLVLDMNCFTLIRENHLFQSSSSQNIPSTKPPGHFDYLLNQIFRHFLNINEFYAK